MNFLGAPRGIYEILFQYMYFFLLIFIKINAGLPDHIGWSDYPAYQQLHKGLYFVSYVYKLQK